MLKRFKITLLLPLLFLVLTTDGIAHSIYSTHNQEVLASDLNLYASASFPDIWEVRQSGERGYYSIHSKNSDLCIDVLEGLHDENLSLITYQCHGGDNQKWRLIPKGGAFYIQSKHSGKYFDTKEKSGEIHLVQTDFKASSSQLWQIEGFEPKWGEDQSTQFYLKYINELLADEPYELVKNPRLGNGCQGTVFKLKSTQDGQYYVVKVPNIGSNSEIDERKRVFEKEYEDSKKLLWINYELHKALSDNLESELQYEVEAQKIPIPNTNWVSKGNKFGLIKDYIPGKSLHYYLTDNYLAENPEVSSKEVFGNLFEVLINLSDAGIYLGDLNYDNLIYSKKHRRWYIIDFLGLTHHKSFESTLFQYFKTGLPIFQWDESFFPNIVFRSRVHDEIARVLQARNYQPYLEAQKLEVTPANIKAGLDPNFKNEQGVPRLFTEKSEGAIAVLVRNGVNLNEYIRDSDKEICAIEYRKDHEVSTDEEMMSLYQAYHSFEESMMRIKAGNHGGFKFVFNEWMPTHGTKLVMVKSFDSFKPEDVKCEGACVQWRQVAPSLPHATNWDFTTYNGNVHLFATDQSNSIFYLDHSKRNPTWERVEQFNELSISNFYLLDQSLIVRTTDGQWLGKSLNFEDSIEDWSAQPWDNVFNANEVLGGGEYNYEISNMIYPINNIRWVFAFRTDSTGTKKFGYFGYHSVAKIWTNWREIEGVEEQSLISWPMGFQRQHNFEEFYFVDGNSNIFKSVKQRNLFKFEGMVPKTNLDDLELNFKKIGTGYLHNWSTLAKGDGNNSDKILANNFYNEQLDFDRLQKIHSSYESQWTRLLSPDVLTVGKLDAHPMSLYTVERIFSMGMDNKNFKKAVKKTLEIKPEHKGKHKKLLLESLSMSLGENQEVQGVSYDYLSKLLSSKVEEYDSKQTPEVKVANFTKAYKQEISLAFKVGLAICVPASAPWVAAGTSIAGDVFDATISGDWPLKAENVAKNACVAACTNALGSGLGGEGKPFEVLKNDSAWAAAGKNFTKEMILNTTKSIGTTGKPPSLKELVVDSGLGAILPDLGSDGDTTFEAAYKAGLNKFKFDLAREILLNGKVDRDAIDQILANSLATIVGAYAGKSIIGQDEINIEDNTDQSENLENILDGQQEPNNEDPNQPAGEPEATDQSDDVPPNDGQADRENEQDNDQVDNAPNTQENILDDDNASNRGDFDNIQDQPDNPIDQEQPTDQNNSEAPLQRQTELDDNQSAHEESRDLDRESPPESGQTGSSASRGLWERMSDAYWYVQNQVGDYCFTENTLVASQSGAKAIQDVKAGDYVWSCDFSNGFEDCKFRKVTKTFVRKVSEVWNLHTQDGKVKVTPNHPLYVFGLGYISLEEIYNDLHLKGYNFKLRTLSGAGSELIHLSKDRGAFWVYNIEVEDAHSYFVSQVANPEYSDEDLLPANPQQWLLSHNCDGPADYQNLEELEPITEGLSTAFSTAAKGLLDPAGLASAVVDYTLDDGVAKDTTMAMIQTVDGVYTIVGGVAVAKFTYKAGKWTASKLARHIPTEKILQDVGEQGAKLIAEFQKTPTGKVLIPKTRLNAVEDVGKLRGNPSSKITPRDNRPYDPNRMRSDLEHTHGSGKVSSTTNPKNPRQRVKSDLDKGIEVINGSNGSKAVKVNYRDPITGEQVANIPYNERGLPVFDDIAKYTTTIDKSKSYQSQMRQATRDLRDGIKSGNIDPSKFTEAQIQDIMKGKAQIEDLTWHHNAISNNFQLVPFSVHDAVKHIGEAALKKGK
ncbi:MAG: RICIN domain-containing protein [Oligoflexales bacterium]